MINWTETKNKFGREYGDISGINPKVVVQCDMCKKTDTRTIKVKSKIINNQMPWVCVKCNCSLPNVKENRSRASKLKMNEETKQKISKSLKGRKRKTPSESTKKKLSESSKKMWKDKRDKFMAHFNSEEHKNALSSRMKSQWNDNNYRKERSETSKRLWNNPHYRSMMEEIFNSEEYIQNKISSHNTIEFIDKMKSISRKLWSNPDYKQKMKDIFRSEEYRSKLSEIMLQIWTDPEYREKMNRIHNSLEYKTKMAEINANSPKVSSIQEQLYSTLRDLGVEFFREYIDSDDDPETIIGPYHFDCVIPRKNQKTLLVECQGDYWHNTEKSINRDRQKASYIKNNFPDRYELKYLWEHEFKCQDKITELIKYWLGITNVELVDFSFNNVEIKECSANDYKLLLSKYHYLPNAGRGGIAYGAYINDTLIAVCIFSPLGRQNLPWDKKTTRELSRLCIHPRYQKKNFASWFVSRCIKRLNPKYKTIISYCDTTFNHDGAVYKACNFELDGEVTPDYWYVSDDGWVMHKKTLYNHARSLGLREKEYAELNGYTKTYGKKKLRFVFFKS